MNQLERQQEQKRRDALVAKHAEIMRYNGASEKSIQKALPGLYELVKYIKITPSDLARHKQEKP